MNKYEILKNDIQELFVDDIYIQHQQIAKCFNTSDVLFKTNEDNVIVYSNNDPNVKFIKTELKIPKTANFSLRANVQKRIIVGNKNPRVPIKEPSLIREWLIKQAQKNGFVLNSFFISNPFTLTGYKYKNDCKLTFNVVDFSGELSVIDDVLFKKVLHDGIGISSSKNFGMGLVNVF